MQVAQKVDTQMPNACSTRNQFLPMIHANTQHVHYSNFAQTTFKEVRNEMQ